MRKKREHNQQVSPEVARVLADLRSYPETFSQMNIIWRAETLLMDDAQGALEPFVLALHNNDKEFRGELFRILCGLDNIKLTAAVKNSANGDEFIRILREIVN